MKGYRQQMKVADGGDRRGSVRAEGATEKEVRELEVLQRRFR